MSILQLKNVYYYVVCDDNIDKMSKNLREQLSLLNF